MPAAAAPLAVARVAEAAAVAVPGVTRLHGGAVGELSTWGGGERVRGVAVQTGPQPSVTIAVVATYGTPLSRVADDVRRRVTDALAEEQPAAATWPVHVHVADLAGADPAPLPGSAP